MYLVYSTTRRNLGTYVMVSNRMLRHHFYLSKKITCVLSPHMLCAEYVKGEAIKLPSGNIFSAQCGVWAILWDILAGFLLICRHACKMETFWQRRHTIPLCIAYFCESAYLAGCPAMLAPGSC